MAGQPIRIEPPMGGLDRTSAYRQQPPYTTRKAQNVRSVGPQENRARMAQRPGLMKGHRQRLGTAASREVRMMGTVRCVRSDGYREWSDTFAGESLGACWTAATWVGTAPGIVPDGWANITLNAECACVRDGFDDLDTSYDYEVGMLIVPWRGEHVGKYRLYVRLDDTTPDLDDAGVEAELVMEDSTGTFSGTLKVYSGGALANTYNFATTESPLGDARPGWFRVVVSTNTVTVYWQEHTLLTQAISSGAGTAMGFGMICTQENEDWATMCLVDTFRVQYYAGTQETYRDISVLSAGGKLYYGTLEGELATLTTNLTINSDVLVHCIDRGGKVYIADWGEPRVIGTDGVVAGAGADELDSASVADWSAHEISTYDDVVVLSGCTPSTADGTYQITTVAAGKLTLASAPGAATACTFRVERGPKVFDPGAATPTLALWAATSGLGQVPTGCPYICRYRDRLVLAGGVAAPHVWYMSRSGDPLDWDYGADGDDLLRAVAGTDSVTGRAGEPINALALTSDDYLVMGCDFSVWRLDGDPCYDGWLKSKTSKVGILDGKAYTWGPDNEFIFWSHDGLYGMAPDAQGNPVSLSRERLPEELRDLDPRTQTLLMEYDVRDRGIHIYCTPSAKGDYWHWWFDWVRKTFWPVRLQDDHEPTAIMEHRSTIPGETTVMLGCRDGWTRRYRDTMDTDDGTEVVSYLEYGPLPLGRDDTEDALVTELEAVLGRNLGEVTWGVRVADTHEGLSVATNAESGTWSAGRNAVVDPRCSGRAFLLRVENAENLRWEIESVTARAESSGRGRKH